MPQNWEPDNWAEAQAATIAREIARVRGQRSAQWLSDRTDELGFRVSRSVITDLENGRRRYVAVHELVMLAIALSIAPLELLYGSDNGRSIEFRPGDEVVRLVAVQQFSGISEDVLGEYEDKMSDLQAAVSAANEAAELLAKALGSKQTAEKTETPENGG